MENITNKIVDIHTHILASVDDGAINNLSDIIEFLDGFTDQDNLKECISAVQRALEDQISEVNRVLTGRIESLTNSISTITSDMIG